MQIRILLIKEKSFSLKEKPASFPLKVNHFSSFEGKYH